MDQRRLRKEARALTPVLEVGKQGITSGVVQQLDAELERTGLVKVRLRRSFLAGKEKGAAVEELAAFSRSRVVDRIGNVVVLHRAKRAR